SSGAFRQLPRGTVLQRIQPDVHLAGAVRVEGDPLPVPRPGAAAVFAARGDDLLRLSCPLSCLGRDRQLPDVGILLEDREGELLAIARERGLDVLAGSRGYLLWETGRRPVGIHRGTPEIQAAGAIGREVDEATRRRPDRVDIAVKIIRDPFEVLRSKVDDTNVELRALNVLKDDAAAIRRPARPYVVDRLG